MRKEQRNSFLRRLGIQRLAAPLSPSNHPRRTVLSEEMVILWHSFIKSNQAGFVRKQFRDVAEQNFNLAIAWLSFLDNNHISHDFDCYDVALQDFKTTLVDTYSAVLSNLKSYRVLPNFRVTEHLTDLDFPTQTLDHRKLNLKGPPNIRLLLLLAPAKKRTIDMRQASGKKLRATSVDSLLDSKLQGYMHKDRGEFLKYQRPMTPDRLFSINEFQWYYKKDSGLRFRHNGNTLAVLYSHQYPGNIPVEPGTSLEQDCKQVMNRAIRGLL